MRRPVKEPGPSPTASPSSSASFTPCRASSSPMTPGSTSLCFWGGPATTCSSTRRSSPTRSTRARDSVSVEVSSERNTALLYPGRAWSGMEKAADGLLVLAAVQPHPRQALVHHLQLLGRAQRHVDDALVLEGPAVVDAHLHGLAVLHVHHPHAAAEAQRAVGRRQGVLVEALAARRLPAVQARAVVRGQPLAQVRARSLRLDRAAYRGAHPAGPAARRAARQQPQLASATASSRTSATLTG